MKAGSYKFKLNYSSLWHLWQGGTKFAAQNIVILRTVFLADVSKWQGVINWSRMRVAGVMGAIIKCGQGTSQDPQFENNWSNAKGNVPRGTYWFWDSRISPKQQAALWWMWIKNDPGELMHFADYEESYGGSFGGWQNFKIFLEEFKRLSEGRVKLGIYTGYYYWLAHSPANLTDLQYFAQFPLWLAWYTSNPANVIIPKPWTNESFIIWQYGITPPKPIVEYGVQSLELDSNNFNGDENKYRDYFNLGEPVPPQEKHTVELTIDGASVYKQEV